MRNSLMVLLVVLSIPVVGYWAANGSQGLLDSQIRDALRDEFPAFQDDSRVSRVTADALCDLPQLSGENLCQTASNLALIKRASIVSGMIGVLLLAVIWLAGRLTRMRRRLLLYVFKPGLYVTALALIGLVITYGGIAIGAIYYGESLLVGRVHLGLIALIGVGALGGVAAIITNSFRIIHKVETTAVGTTVSQDEAPGLWGTVEDVAESIGALMPDHIVLGMEPNFFVTEGNVICLDGTLTGRTLYCSLPLMRIMDEEEATAVLVHELAHFKGEDTKFSRRFYPIYRGTQDSIESLWETGGEGWKLLVLLPAIAVFRFFLNSFARAEREIGRAREIEADAEAAAVCGRATLGSALTKVHAFSPAWPVIQEQLIELLRNGQMFRNLGAQFAATVNDAAAPKVLEGVTEQRMTHPTDSHPPLAKRLEALDLSIGELESRALRVSPENSAIGLVTRGDELEAEISDAYQVVIAQRLGINL